jgi:hypothetical protein
VVEHHKRRVLPGTPAQHAELRRYLSIAVVLMLASLAAGLAAGYVAGRLL